MGLKQQDWAEGHVKLQCRPTKSLAIWGGHWKVYGPSECSIFEQNGHFLIPELWSVIKYGMSPEGQNLGWDGPLQLKSDNWRACSYSWGDKSFFKEGFGWPISVSTTTQKILKKNKRHKRGNIQLFPTEKGLGKINLCGDKCDSNLDADLPRWLRLAPVLTMPPESYFIYFP